MAKPRLRATANSGSPELTPADLPGTAFLLAAGGRVRGDPIKLARCAHRRDVIDLARRKALTPRARAYERLRVSQPVFDHQTETGGARAAGDFVDPDSSAQVRAVENRDLVERVLEALTPTEADVLRWRAAGVDFTEIAGRLGVCVRTIEARWAAMRNRARALLEV